MFLKHRGHRLRCEVADVSVIFLPALIISMVLCELVPFAWLMRHNDTRIIEVTLHLAILSPELVRRQVVIDVCIMLWSSISVGVHRLVHYALIYLIDHFSNLDHKRPLH